MFSWESQCEEGQSWGPMLAVLLLQGQGLFYCILSMTLLLSSKMHLHSFLTTKLQTVLLFNLCFTVLK